MHQSTNTKTLASKALVSHFRGEEEALRWFNFELTDPGDVIRAGQQLLASVPPALGYCVLLSSAWAAFLREHYSIPAIVVAGDLSVDGDSVFSAHETLPDGSGSGLISMPDWSGHCWIEIGGYIGDISIFRTAYAAPSTHPLARYIARQKFERKKGILLASASDATEFGFGYTPRFVLTDQQVYAFAAGLGYLVASK